MSPLAHNETINATMFRSACIQVGPPPFVIPAAGSEDCLFLNVYASTVATGEPLPVMVWIHGGGYGAGDGSQDMSEIINANKDGFLVVSINYRVRLRSHTFAKLSLTQNSLVHLDSCLLLN